MKSQAMLSDGASVYASRLNYVVLVWGSWLPLVDHLHQ